MTKKQQQAPRYAKLTRPEAESRFQACFTDRYVGNEDAVEVLGDILVPTMMDEWRVVPKNGVMLVGPASTGKTTLNTLTVAYTELPSVVSENNIRNADDLFKALQRVFSELTGATGRQYALVEEEPRRFRVPPCVVFIDEAHKLPDHGEWLLKPTEPSDRTMILRDGRLVDTGYIFWMLGTTNPAELVGPLRTRLRVINLRPYTTAQVAEIVRRAKKLGPTECLALAKMSRSIPRVALNYADEARLHCTRSGVAIEAAVQVVAKRLGLDRFGLTSQHREVLKQLGAVGRLAKPRLAMAVGVDVDWLEEEVLPGLWQATDESPALIRMGARGIELTDDGQAMAAGLAA
jgi:Holliday junction resolvasome RuvABC ATP-dependent DNA helicase subunit